ncbi:MULTISPECIES: hypothetical protein [unclassified Pseudomonas]|uniref:hypothetical protein n=1 Tax=unclassified Pseudomonas TaxID=196821 RepID=UPI0005C8B120|nr:MULTISPECIES: hypothetical protein [unclassified Pseudomonas]MDU9397945.1 hypothetical protein [Pseudomonas sp. zfem003]
MNGVWLLPLGLLAGCVAPAVPPPMEVRVPVPVPCRVELPAAPAFAVSALALDAPIDQQMKALRAERLQRMGYERELVAALDACR